MAEAQKTCVAVNGYGVIGKRVAAAVARQPDMSLAGVSDVVTAWRAHMVTRNGFLLFGATTEHRRDACGGLKRNWHTGRVARPGGCHRGLYAQAHRCEVRVPNESIIRTNTALGIDMALM